MTRALLERLIAAGTVAVVIGTGALTAVRLIELFPLEHDISASSSYGDDWYAYDLYARSILDEGLTMPIVTGAYMRPAGFSYPYFVAGIYAIAGVRSEVVYLVHAMLLLAGTIWMAAIFRGLASRLATLLCVAVLVVVGYVDVFRALTFRLLSENVLFVLWPAILFFGLRAESRRKTADFAATGLLCGIAFLMRPNLALVAPAVAFVIFKFSSMPSRALRAQAAAIVLIAWALVGSLMAVRNYVVTGRPSLAAVTSTSDWWLTTQITRPGLSIGQRLQRMMRSVASRAAYVIGIPYFRAPTFRLRPHWLILWAVFIWYLFTLRRRTLPFWEQLVLAIVIAYFGPMLAAGYVSNYGVRNLAPGLPLVALLAVRGIGLSAPRQSPG